MEAGGVAALIALDWGTTSLRAYLLGAGGAVLDRRAEPWGVMQLPGGDFAAAFDRVTAGWRERHPGVPAIASGMVGSAQGWVPAPYCPCPAGVEDLAAALTPAHAGALRIVPGVSDFGDRPNVMRGEETQVAGVLEARPELAGGSLLVLPGTHSKWVRVADGKIRSFDTYMTGELFAVLRAHSILGRPARDAGDAGDAGDAASDPAGAEEAFARGVLAARGAARGIAPLLFSARALVLAGRLAAAASLDYLSGLLIGEELRCGLAGPPGALALVGDAALCRRYAAALRRFGVEDDVPVVGEAAPVGLWSIARRAGLLPASAGAATALEDRNA